MPATLLRRLPKPAIYPGWWVVSAPFLAAMLTVGSGQYAFAHFVEPLEETFGWTRTQINLSLSFTAVGSMIAPILGWIMDRRGARGIMLGSIAFIIAGYLLRPFMAELWHWYALSLLQFIGYAGASILPAGRLVGIWFPKTRGRVMGITLMGNNAGGIAFPILTTAALAASWQWAGITLAPWQGGYIIFGAIGIALLAYTAAVVRDFPPTQTAAASNPADAPANPNADASKPANASTAPSNANAAGTTNAADAPSNAADAPSNADASNRANPKTPPPQPTPTPTTPTPPAPATTLTGWSLGEALRSKAFYAITIATLLGTFTYSAILPQILTHLTSVGVPKAEASWALSSVALCGMTGKFVMGLLSERITARYALMIDLTGQATFLLLFTQFAGQSPILMWLFVPAFGFFLGAFGALFPIIVQDTFGIRRYGSIMGVINMTTAVSFFIGPLIAGVSFDITGSYRIAFFAVAALFYAGALTLTQAKQPQRRPQ